MNNIKLIGIVITSSLIGYLLGTSIQEKNIYVGTSGQLEVKDNANDFNKVNSVASVQLEEANTLQESYSNGFQEKETIVDEMTELFKYTVGVYRKGMPGYNTIDQYYQKAQNGEEQFLFMREFVASVLVEEDNELSYTLSPMADNQDFIEQKAYEDFIKFNMTTYDTEYWGEKDENLNVHVDNVLQNYLLPELGEVIDINCQEYKCGIRVSAYGKLDDQQRKQLLKKVKDLGEEVKQSNDKYKLAETSVRYNNMYNEYQIAINLYKRTHKEGMEALFNDYHANQNKS